MDDKLKFPEISGQLDDLENIKLRKEILELKTRLQSYERLLKDNGLLGKLTSISDEESILVNQIAKLKEVDDKGIPFLLEDVKVLEILVKTLQIARGKAPVVIEKPKKQEKVDVATLLKLAGEKE